MESDLKRNQRRHRPEEPKHRVVVLHAEELDAQRVREPQRREDEETEEGNPRALFSKGHVRECKEYLTLSQLFFTAVLCEWYGSQRHRLQVTLIPSPR